jgi:hypothetical protein
VPSKTSKDKQFHINQFYCVTKMKITRINSANHEFTVYVENDDEMTSLISFIQIQEIIQLKANEAKTTDISNAPTKIDENGNKYWRNKAGQLHRDNDKPACVYTNGHQFWYQNDKLHRDNDLPAVVCADGTQYWYQHGLRHRDNDKPAAVYADGNQYWYQHGNVHRDNDLPACVYTNGHQFWYQNGLFHRDNDKPAVVFINGRKEWYQNGILIRSSQ